MIVAIDEAGDPGFKFTRGSSRYFCMVAVCFSNGVNAKESTERINALKIKMQRNLEYEFKYHKVRSVTKEKFYKEINNLNFDVKIVCIDKITINEETAVDFYSKTLLELINSIDACGLKIFLDGEAGRKHAKIVKTFLRKTAPKGKIKSFAYRDSRSDNLIQMADMIAGAVLQKANSEKDEYLKIIRRHLK